MSEVRFTISSSNPSIIVTSMRRKKIISMCTSLHFLITVMCGGRLHSWFVSSRATIRENAARAQPPKQRELALACLLFSRSASSHPSACDPHICNIFTTCRISIHIHVIAMSCSDSILDAKPWARHCRHSTCHFPLQRSAHYSSG